MVNQTAVLKLVVIVLGSIYGVNTEELGASCSQDGVVGTCRLLSHCQPVLDNPRTQWWRLHRCGTKDLEPIICCIGPAVTSTAGPVATTPRLSASTTEYSPPEYDYHTSEPLAAGCAAPAQDVTPARTGRRGWDKCIDYQQELVYPCERGVALTQDMRRANHCRSQVEESGGYERGDYSYMVLLALGALRFWACSGTLLSDRFILTAADCNGLNFYGQLTYARVGYLRRTNDHRDVSHSQDHRIKRVIIHPQYSGEYSFHDIALAETETKIILNRWIVPACLHVFGGDVPQATTTGWALTLWDGYTDNLQKMTVTKLKAEDCQKNYWNFTEPIEMCYGNPAMEGSACGSYSGGPLMIRHPHIRCMIAVAGVATRARGCGAHLGAYASVAEHAAWIEGVVWP